MGGTQIQAHEAAGRCIAVLDVGTTAVKACLFSPSLELLACSVQEYALRTQGERVEADAAQYKAAARAGLADALSQAPGCIPAARKHHHTRRNAHARGPFGRAASPLSGVAGQPRGK